VSSESSPRQHRGTRTVFLVRHGESEANRAGTLTVRLTLEDRDQPMTWQPLATESVFPLLRE
jgi:hypothetical protein